MSSWFRHALSSQTIGLLPCASANSAAHEDSVCHLDSALSCQLCERNASTSPSRQRRALAFSPVSSFDAKSSSQSTSNGRPVKVRRDMLSTACGSSFPIMAATPAARPAPPAVATRISHAWMRGRNK
eukprot:scaffold39029_cov57-Phaeocystis_antarctica.AAC.2